jgi:hypothetical protein
MVPEGFIPERILIGLRDLLYRNVDAKILKITTRRKRELQSGRSQ